MPNTGCGGAVSQGLTALRAGEVASRARRRAAGDPAAPDGAAVEALWAVGGRFHGSHRASVMTLPLRWRCRSVAFRNNQHGNIARCLRFGNPAFEVTVGLQQGLKGFPIGLQVGAHHDAPSGKARCAPCRRKHNAFCWNPYYRRSCQVGTSIVAIRFQTEPRHECLPTLWSSERRIIHRTNCLRNR